MIQIDKEWLSKRLEKKRGEQARLARFLGITNDQMSKTLKGSRRIQPEEIPRLMEFFDVNLQEHVDPDLAEIQRLWPQLSPANREFLRRSAKAQLVDPDLSHPPEDED